MHEGDIVNEYHTNLDGCGYVMAMGEDVKEVAERAEKVCTEIEAYIYDK